VSFPIDATARVGLDTQYCELASVGKRVELVIRTRPMLPDPNDEMVLETAVHGRSDAIVTFNDRDFRPVAARFRCSVLRPGVVIRGLCAGSKHIGEIIWHCLLDIILHIEPLRGQLESAGLDEPDFRPPRAVHNLLKSG
jgi:hypothetical protein